MDPEGVSPAVCVLDLCMGMGMEQKRGKEYAVVRFPLGKEAPDGLKSFPT